MANNSGIQPPSSPQPFNRELFHSKLLPKDKKSQVLFAKVTQASDTPLELKKISGCIEAIQGKDKVTALEKYEQAMASLAKEISENQDLKTKQLLGCCLQLLHPDPKKCWATDQLFHALN